MDEKTGQVGSSVLAEVLESMWQEDETKVAKRLNCIRVIEVSRGCIVSAFGLAEVHGLIFFRGGFIACWNNEKDKLRARGWYLLPS